MSSCGIPLDINAKYGILLSNFIQSSDEGLTGKNRVMQTQQITYVT